MERTAIFCLILVFCLISLTKAAPKPQYDDDDDVNENVMPHLINQSVNYNVMMSHFKDFFMYLPVMFTTFQETMSGFPKLAEGIRILTSPTFKKSNDDDNDCKCKVKSIQNSNEIDKSSHLLK